MLIKIKFQESIWIKQLLVHKSYNHFQQYSPEAGDQAFHFLEYVRWENKIGQTAHTCT